MGQTRDVRLSASGHVRARPRSLGGLSSRRYQRRAYRRFTKLRVSRPGQSTRPMATQAAHGNPDMNVVPLRQRPAWKALQTHAQSLRGVHLRQLFAEDPKRGERMAVEGAGIYFDYSKNRVTAETLRLLLQLAEESGLRERID